MHSDGPRINGGIGFAVEGPECAITARRSSGITLIDLRPCPFSKAEREQLTDRIIATADQMGLPLGVEITLAGNMLTHVGLGSGTAIRLAVVESFCLLYDKQPNRETLVALSGRGGTSGVGINAYFDGGLILDLGRTAQGPGFVPSSIAGNVAAPLALPSVPMPIWPLFLCIPKVLLPKNQAEEIAFFKRVAPLAPEASYYAAYEALFGLYGSAAENNYDGFNEAVNRMQATAWKKAEREEYEPHIGIISGKLRNLGALSVGLSSLGPLLFGFGEPLALDAILRCDISDEFSIVVTQPRNSGRVIMDDNNA
jgi:beta-ribofuranosylaminobenzene 5'-phosphate synthase